MLTSSRIPADSIFDPDASQANACLWATQRDTQALRERPLEEIVASVLDAIVDCRADQRRLARRDACGISRFKSMTNLTH